MNKSKLYDIEYFEKLKRKQKYKRRLKIRRSFMFIVLTLLFLIYAISPLSKVVGITINGNSLHSDVIIKQMADIEEGQYKFLKPPFLINYLLVESDLFSKVEVTRNLHGEYNINVIENRILFYFKKDKEYIFVDELGNRFKINDASFDLYRSLVPELVGDLPENVMKNLIENLVDVDSTLTKQISQILYTPLDFDEYNFRFIMNSEDRVIIDGNVSDLVIIGSRYHTIALNANYKCTILEIVDIVVVERECD